MTRTRRQSERLTYEADVENGAQKMKELILYISEKCQDKSNFGSIVLNKMLWFSDFEHFLKYGAPITGQKYHKQRKGPVPYSLLPLRRELEQAGDLAIQQREYWGTMQKRPIALRPANLNLFSAQEISVVDDIIARFCHLSGERISDVSHGVAWKTREDYDLLPYESAYLSDEPITADDIARTRELNEQYKWIH